MTEAEKAAAAKAEEEKKLAAEKEANDKKAKEAEESDDEAEEDDEPDDTETVEQLKARLKKVNESDKKRRLENKRLNEELGKHKQLNEQEKAVEAAKKEANAKNARILLKAELAMAAKDAHDPQALFRAYGEKFADIDVDLENETVDKDALKSALDEIREEAPFMFKSSKNEPLDADDDDGKTRTIIKKNPDKGRQGGGGSELKEWQKMKDSGDKKGAQAFYAKNRDKILIQIGK